MKRLALGMLLAGLISPATAEETEICQKFYTLSTTIMDARQAGRPLSDLLSLVDEDSVLRNIIIRAYEYPLMEHADLKEIAISEFANNEFLACVEARRNQ